jgi:hypothetical protein
MSLYRRSDRYNGDWNKSIVEEKRRRSKDNKINNRTVSGIVLNWIFGIFIFIVIVGIILGILSGVFGITVLNTKIAEQNSRAQIQFAGNQSSSSKQVPAQSAQAPQSTTTTPSTVETPKASKPSTSESANTQLNIGIALYTLKTITPNGETKLVYYNDLKAAITEGVNLVNSGQATNYWVTSN